MIFPQMRHLSSCLPEISEFNQELTIALVQVRQAVVDYMLKNEEDFVYFLAPATRPAYKKVGYTVLANSRDITHADTIADS